MNPNDTVKLVPIGELLALANLGAAMRRAQRAYFAKRASAPHAPHGKELAAAKDAERRFDLAVAAALASERPNLPGLGAEGGAA